MRKTAIVLALILVASLGVAVPFVSAASGDPRVVIIVGATHGMTADYRARADEAYAEAIKYTSNVVKVYSPDATWANVKAAVAGASIVIYMGHGNGWPSPYPLDPNYTTKDGFGLNATAGAGDYNNKYYGEPSVATLGLAPGAIVLLNSLCYASGNSEPGNPEPTVPVARQRTDNYAAGFLKAGAAAVLADGHAGPVGYLRSLFTTHQTLDEMWRNQANANGNVVSFASSRTPGATAFQDPNTPTSGFYRSLVMSTIGTTTDDVVSSRVGGISANPLSLTIPGNAAVAIPPQLTALTPDAATTPWFSPNGDAYRDTVTWRATGSESGSLVVRIGALDGTLVRTWTVANGTGPTAVTWDGRGADGLIVPDGTYEVRVSPSDAVGNTGPGAARLVRVVGALRSVATSRAIIYPQDGDSLATTTDLSFSLARPMTVTWTLRDAAGTIVDTHLAGVQVPAGTQRWTFDGHTSAGAMLPVGRYTSYVRATDGMLTATQSVSFNAMAFVISPNDSTPGRGQPITITALSAESLAAAPRLFITQPGKPTWSVAMVKSATNTYRANVTLKIGGPAGRVSFEVFGTDSGGLPNRTTISLALH